MPAAIAKWGRVKTLLFETMVVSNRCYSSVRLVNAAKAAQADGIRSLLATKADPNSFDGKVTALHACVESGHAGGDAIGAARLLLESGALPDLVYPAVGHGRTALARAAQGGKVELLEVLLKAGADPCAMDSEGDLPIDMQGTCARSIARRCLGRGRWRGRLI